MGLIKRMIEKRKNLKKEVPTSSLAWLIIKNPENETKCYHTFDDFVLLIKSNGRYFIPQTLKEVVLDNEGNLTEETMQNLIDAKIFKKKFFGLEFEIEDVSILPTVTLERAENCIRSEHYVVEQLFYFPSTLFRKIVKEIERGEIITVKELLQLVDWIKDEYEAKHQRKVEKLKREREYNQQLDQRKIQAEDFVKSLGDEQKE